MVLPRLLAMCMTHTALPALPQGSASLAALHGATLELLCRSLAALGQETPSLGSNAGPATGPLNAAAQHEPQPQQRQRPHQQQEAFDALLVHISAYCYTLMTPAASTTTPAVDVSLVSPASVDAAADGRGAGARSRQMDSDAGVAAGDVGLKEEEGAPSAQRLAVLLAQRAFGEMTAAITAAAADGMGCGRAQTLLLHLLKVGCGVHLKQQPSLFLVRSWNCTVLRCQIPPCRSDM